MEHFFTYLGEADIKVENVVIIDATKEILKVIITTLNMSNHTVFFIIYRNDNTNKVEKIYVYDGLKGSIIMQKTKI